MFDGGVVRGVVQVKPLEVCGEGKDFDGGDGRGAHCLYHILCGVPFVSLVCGTVRVMDVPSVMKNLPRAESETSHVPSVLVTVHGGAGFELQGLDGGEEFAVGVSFCMRCVHPHKARCLF